MSDPEGMELARRYVAAKAARDKALKDYAEARLAVLAHRDETGKAPPRLTIRTMTRTNCDWQAARADGVNLDPYIRETQMDRIYGPKALP